MEKTRYINAQNLAKKIAYFASRLEDWGLHGQAETAKTITKVIKSEPAVEIVDTEEYKELEKKIKKLEKSNRNWRRKVQRLRNGSKENGDVQD